MVAISLVIVTHDSRADIEECLHAVARQKVASSFETIVVDNGSQDGTADLVRQRFPKVRVVEQRNLGFGAGNNRGVREARGEVVVFLNPDTVAEPGFLAALHAAVAPHQAATAQVVLRHDPQRIHTLGHSLHFTGYGFVANYRGDRQPPGPPTPTGGVSGCAFAMRRDDFLALGGFDEDFFLYVEDTELSWRMHRAGFRVVVAPSAVVEHTEAPELLAHKVGLVETGRLLLLRKHLPVHLWLAYLPSLVLCEALSWTRAAWLGPAGLAAKLGSLRHGWRGGIRRPNLPRARPHLFAARDMPFAALSSWRSVRVAGWIVNAVFRLNTATWPLRRRL